MDVEDDDDDDLGLAEEDEVAFGPPISMSSSSSISKS